VPRVLGRGLEVFHVLKDQHKGDDENVKSTYYIVGDPRVLGPREY